MTKNLLVYEASAGTGKTFTLVKKYLQWALDDPSVFSQILATTFTNKAAIELKYRILGQLEQWAGGTPGPMGQIIQEANSWSDADLSSRAKYLLGLILHRYDQFQVSTLDAFAQKIIKAFYRELKLPAEYEVVLEKEIVLDEMIRKLLLALDQDENLFNRVYMLLQSRINSEKSWGFQLELKDIANQLLEETEQGAGKWVEEMAALDMGLISKNLDREKNRVIQQLKQLGAEAKNTLDHFEIGPNDLFYGSKGIYSYFRKAWEGDIKGLSNPNNYVNKTIQEDRWQASKTTNSSAVQSAKAALMEHYRKIHEFAEQNLPLYLTRDQLARNLSLTFLLSDLQLIINQIIEEDRIIHISEFNKRIASLVRHQPIPFIFERLGEKIKHFLIDEFQDTSLLQWQNLIPLVENGLSEGKQSMLVGDPKQSIYRFRQGEVEQLLRLPSIYKLPAQAYWKEREQAFKRNFQKETLRYNYRSLPAIVNFNNDFFAYASKKLVDAYREVYQDLNQQSKRTDGEGYVHITGLDREVSQIDYYKYLLACLTDCLDEGYSYRDIAVLVEKNKTAEELAGLFMEKGWPVVSSDAMLLCKNEVVNLIMGALLYQENEPDKNRLAEVCSSLYRLGRIPEKIWLEILGLCHQDDGKVIKLLKDQGIEWDRLLQKQRTLLEQYLEILKVFRLDEWDPYVQSLGDELLAFSKSKHWQSRGLQLWWESKRLNLKLSTSEQINAIRVMTIHKSKGLEFPVIILPNDPSKKPKQKLTRQHQWLQVDPAISESPEYAYINMSSDTQNTFWAEEYEKEVQKTFFDRFNETYVAFTRAADRLYIFTTRPEKQDPIHPMEMLWQYCHFENGPIQMKTFGEKHPHISLQSGEKATKPIQLTPFGETVSFQLKDALPANSFEQLRGNVYHDLLSRIDSYDDLPQAIIWMENAYNLQAEEAKSIGEVCWRMIRHPELRAFFEPGILAWNELELTNPQSELKRLDRLVFREGQYHILEYKTTLLNSMHESQTREYLQTLRAAVEAPANAVLIGLLPELEIKFLR